MTALFFICQRPLSSRIADPQFVRLRMLFLLALRFYTHDGNALPRQKGAQRPESRAIGR